MNLTVALRFVLAIAITTVILTTPSVNAQQSTAARLPNPFFAFDNGTGRGSLPPQQQAQMLKELGYDGIGFTGAGGIPEMLAALDAVELKMFSIYVNANIQGDAPAFTPGLRQGIQDLKGRDTVVWLTVTGRTANGQADAAAVTAVQQVADWAAESNLRVALYPHVGFYVATTEDSVRVAEKAGRDNVGSTFNLCQFLKLDQAENLDSVLQRASANLMLVSINGAEHDGGWDRLIQTLDRGAFDNVRLLKTLRRIGYTGPVGLQCYAVKGDRRENLRRSIDAWRTLSTAAAQ